MAYKNMILTHRDTVLDDYRFVKLGFDDSQEFAVNAQARSHFDVNHALALLAADPALGARLLACDQQGSIFWTGPLADQTVDGEAVGTRVVKRRDRNGSLHEEAIGENVFGRFLDRVRMAYAEYLKANPVVEAPVRKDQVVTDFVRKGAFESDIEHRERNGANYIHTDVYKAVRFSFDTGLDGTTGHAERRSEADVKFHSFVCPFGTSYPSPIIVGSAAEASLLYEQAIRGEVDWKALFNNLRERGLLNKKLTQRQIDAMVSDYRSQFEWMREQIVTNPDLRGRQIVAASALVPDASMGRSVYDPVYAPSPAHVLARYINNPVLLFTESENGVMRSLSLPQKNESVALDGQDVSVLVIGSDTIGGREPGRKATTTFVRNEDVDEKGNKIITKNKSYAIPMKDDVHQRRDYEAFSARMAEVTRGLKGKVMFLSGSASSMGDTVGVGTPRMVERYIRDKGGAVYTWNYYKGVAEPRGWKEGDPKVNTDLSIILFDHFAEALPVLTGKEEKVQLVLPEESVEFTRAQLKAADAAVCFSVEDDANNRNVLSMGSFAADSGLPVVHVHENQSEKTQLDSLVAGAYLSRSGNMADQVETESLLVDVAPKDWDLRLVNNLSLSDDVTGLVIPSVADRYPMPVLVDGYGYHSVMSSYVAMCAKDSGRGDAATMNSIIQAEGSVSELVKIHGSIVNGDEAWKANPNIQERLMRQAVRQMARANSEFAEKLYALDDRSVVMPSSSGDVSLFVDREGHGENRFGIAFGAEAAMLKALRDARLRQEEQERQKIVETAARQQKLAVSDKAEGEKVKGGFPATPQAAGDAVWFLGTNTPGHLALKEDDISFDMWDDNGGDDPLVREKVARDYIEFDDGSRGKNNFVYLFPSDLAATTGRRSPRNMPDSRDLTGVVRKDEVRGDSFVAAYGIPVRFNNKGDELNNAEGRPCSYRLDNDASNYAASLVLADSKARSMAISRGLYLCLPGRTRLDGTRHYTLPQVFMDKSYSKRDGWIDNPHKAPLNERLTRRYIDLLERGKNYPLNFIPLPKAVYSNQSDSYVDMMANDGKSVSAEADFLADLTFSLKVANATAITLGVPLRFPLDENGRIDLGPGVPEEFRAIAERKIDSFIGVVRKEDIIEGELPLVERISFYEASKSRDSMHKAGNDLYMRPNDLATAFGPYDFSKILIGQPSSLHEMAFRMGEHVYIVTDAKSTRGVDINTINGYLAYSKNDERRFTIRTTNPDGADEFVSAVKAYCERAREIKVEARLVQESELKQNGIDSTSLDGYVYLHSSNDDEFIIDEKHEIGREATIFNAASRLNQQKVHDASGTTRITESYEERSLDGDALSGKYFGKVDANDGFKGYAQYRYQLPDGQKSGWITVEDTELAKDMVMSMVHRVYRDDRTVPSDAVLEMFYRAKAVEHAGDAFRNMEWESRKDVVLDDKVVEIAPAKTGSETAISETAVSEVATEVGPKVYEGDITPGGNTVFVFGSNPEGRHGAGAARVAKEQFGAVYGQGEGLQGMSYALPTKDLRVAENHGYRSISPQRITESVKALYQCAREHPELDFKIAYRNTDKMSLNGYTGLEMIDMFLAAGEAPANVYISKEWADTGLFKSVSPAVSVNQSGTEFIGERLSEGAAKGGRVFVTYYGSDSVPDDAIKVQISTSCPKNFEPDFEFRSAYPDFKSMVGPHKEGKIDDAGYTARYQKEVLEKNSRAILDGIRQMQKKGLEQGSDVYLFCYCKPGDFCHRYLLANYLNENGIACEENPADRQLYVKGHVEMVPVAKIENIVPEVEPIVFAESSGGYQKRTYENANADDVDFTLAFAADFSTYGERATAKAAGDSLIPVELPIIPEKGIDLSAKAVKAAVDIIIESLPEEFRKGESFGVNIAGNGLYTLAAKGADQQQCDEFVTKVLVGLQKKGVVISSVRTGGQTGIDEAGAVAGIILDLPVVVNAPAGWQMRDAAGHDTKDEAAFKQRFADKDYARLAQQVKLKPRTKTPSMKVS